MSGWDVSNVTLMEHIFQGAWSIKCDTRKWNKSKVTDVTDFRLKEMKNHDAAFEDV